MHLNQLSQSANIGGRTNSLIFCMRVVIIKGGTSHNPPMIIIVLSAHNRREILKSTGNPQSINTITH